MTRASLAEQLTVVRQRLGPGVPKTCPIMHLVAELVGPAPDEAAATARDQALRWITRRTGFLPDEAWRHESFVHPMPGSSAAGVRLRSDEADWWSARCDDPDRHVPGRTWVAELAIVRHRRGARFGLRWQVVSREPAPSFRPAVAGIVRRLAEAPGLELDGRHLSPEPWLVRDQEALAGLVALIERPDRRAPVVVVSLAEGEEDPATAAVPVGLLAQCLVGLAHVAVLPGEATFGLTKAWGKPWSCFHRAVRVYRPGFDRIAGTPYDHPLLLPPRLASWAADQGEDAAVDHLVRECTRESLRRFGDERDLPTFTRVKQAALQRERDQAARHGGSDKDLLALAEDLLREKEAESEQLLSLVGEEERRRQEAEEAVARLRAESHVLRARLATLEEQLRSLGRDVDADVPIPATLDALKPWADVHLAGRVVLTPRAVRAAKDAPFENVPLVYRALLLLGGAYRRMRLDGGAALTRAFAAALQELGLQNEPSGEEARLRAAGEAFLVPWKGRMELLRWHLKNRGNTRDPRRCFRLYYFWDDDDQLVVVGSLPGHLRTWLT